MRPRLEFLASALEDEEGPQANLIEMEEVDHPTGASSIPYIPSYKIAIIGCRRVGRFRLYQIFGYRDQLGLVVRIHDLRVVNRGFRSQKSQCWQQEGPPTLIRFNKVAPLTPRPRDPPTPRREYRE